VFSVRIVSMDYYMTRPVPGLDISYTSVHGGQVNQVPVIRIYGSTPAGQKTCLHIHRVLPYLYIAWSDLGHMENDEVDSRAYSLSLTLDKALKLNTNAGQQQQHVHGYELVRAKKFYGYHASEELFIKIYLYPEHISYFPQDVSCAANLLLLGAVCNMFLQPYESHIPFLLQFLIDYNLYGMGHLHVSKLMFRYPIPAVCNLMRGDQNSEVRPLRKCSGSRELKDFSEPFWTASTVPDGWVWPDFGRTNSLGDEDNLLLRQSTCELEGDAVADDIINQQFISYSPLSESHSGVKMVQSLIQIWEEEYDMNQPPEESPSELGRPTVQNVLSSLSNGLKFGDFLGIKDDTESLSQLNSESVESLAAHGDLIHGSLAQFEDSNNLKASDRHGSQDSPLLDIDVTEKLNALGSGGPSCSKVVDVDAMRLLKWLASSQAMEDINSDDELTPETVFSPLLPKDIKRVLDKASAECQLESQKECQDILNSIDIPQFKELDDRSFMPAEPQVDGSSDDSQFIQRQSQSPQIDSIVAKLDEKINPDHEISPIIMSDHRGKRPRWGSLPVFSKNLIDFGKPDTSSVPGGYDNEKKALSISWSGNETEILSGVTPLYERKFSHSKQSNTELECSIRDLMRRKRSHQSQNPEYGITEEMNEEVASDGETEEGDIDPEPCEMNDSEDAKALKLPINEVPSMTRRLLGSPERGIGYTSKACDEGNNSKNLGSELKNNNLMPTSGSCTLNHAPDSKTIIFGEHCDSSVPRDVGLHSPTEILGETSNKAEIVGLVAMTFSKKPPDVVCINDAEGDVPFLLENESRQVGASLCHNYLPFFTRNGTEEELHAEHDYAVGVPVTHQFDGSCSFMLGFARSPPSWVSVDTWLSLNGYSIFGKYADPGRLQRDDQDFVFVVPPDEKLNIETQGTSQGSDSVEVRTSSDRDVNVTRSTLSSQISFRDPANEGQGQQLTLLSIEVQAESRGNLRPDPRFDAINVIVLVCQEDDEDNYDAVVLLRCGSASAKDVDAISESKVLVFPDELQVLDYFGKFICSLDPDILMGWDIQSGSLGFLAERAAHLHVSLLSNISRTRSPSSVASEPDSERGMEKELFSGSVRADSAPRLQDTVIDDDWGRTHASGIHVGGRIVLNVWRLMRNEIKQNLYTVEAVAETVLRRKIPCIPWRVLTKWFTSGPGKARHRAIQYALERAKLNLQIMNQLDVINRTSELARVFGIDFFSVLSRGSQYRVESMLLRLARTQNYLVISPGKHQVANQPAMECLPLVMEPESSFYADPVVVLDFQSLYPSMVIAYNLCYCTCLGKITPGQEDVLGVCSYKPPAEAMRPVKHELLVTPNGVAYVPKEFRQGILPRLLEEILSTRIMVKKAMKRSPPSRRARQRILNARQLALKLIANVTYGYTAAGFSGRMPCAEIADSIVQCGRRTLETAISFVNSNHKWKGRVIYGDTDSMFVLLKGRSLQEAFRIGQEIASAVTDMNPAPVKLKMEKVYHPCFLLTKKRYVGYSYESPDQSKPTFDAKGIETVRRDTCGAVSKLMERSLRIYFESQDIDKVKAYLQRQWKRISTGRASLQDFIFAKEVRLGSYSEQRAYALLPPAAIVATKSMREDPRSEPRYAERVPYVVVHGEPGCRLADMVVDPHEVLDPNSPLRLNDVYYITKQIISALQRVFGLVGADLNLWFQAMPRIARQSSGSGRHPPLQHRTRIEYYYASKHCILCGNLVEGSTSTRGHLCRDCSEDEVSTCVALTGRSCKLEKDFQRLNAVS
ncbi:hypothetical protein M569_02103, partial [Genlisea aurea]